MPVKSIPRDNSGLNTLRIVSVVLFAIMLFAFCLTGYIATHHPRLAFDTAVFESLRSIRNPFTTRCVIAITFFGSRNFLFPCYAVLVIYYLFLRKKIWLAVALALTGFLGNELLYLMQDMFGRIRPADPLISGVTGYGYPSGHSFASFVFAGLCCFLIWQQNLPAKLKIMFAILFFCMASVIAITRPYLHVHYPTDVLGGFFLSIVWLIPCFWLLYFIYNKRHR